MFRKVPNPGDEMNERVQSIGGMILEGKKWSNQTKTYPRATLSINATWTGLGLTPALCSEGPVTAWAMAQPEQNGLKMYDSTYTENFVFHKSLSTIRARFYLQEQKLGYYKLLYN